MLISIGILARNEGATIVATVASLFQQSALRLGVEGLSDPEWEIIIVPNGCSDDTAAKARAALTDLSSQGTGLKIRWAVHELAEGGKSNAWNRYVHEFSSPQAELIVMLDADIQFGEPDTISNTIKALMADSAAVVAVDLPLKDVGKKPKQTLLERLSLAGSRQAASGPIGISGQFFCARAAALRQIWMPKGLSVEDGFLRAMIVTDCFRSPVDEKRVIRAPNATHYYEALTSLTSLFQHELRLVVGTAMNCYLTWDFLLYATNPNGDGAGALILSRMTQDPEWYATLMANAIRNRGWWVLPRGTFFRRFDRVKHQRGASLIKALPVATMGFLLDVPVFVAANRKLKTQSAVGYW